MSDYQKELNQRLAWNRSMYRRLRECSFKGAQYIRTQIERNDKIIAEIKELNY